jgi:PAS domain S-box-containing protein
LTFLYVEDEPVTRDAVCSLLRRKFPDVRILTAHNGEEGLELFTEHTPNVVITDIRMPAMNGIEMARKIRALNGTTRIVVTTAHGDLEYLIDAIEIGINRYVMKPIDKDKLFAALEDCIAGAVLERRVAEQQEFIHKLTRAVEQGPSMVVITDTEGTIEYVNPKFTEITGYTPRELVGHALKSDDIPQEAADRLWSTLKGGLEWHGEYQNRTKDGVLYWESASVSPIFDASGVITHFVAVKEDITERKNYECEIERLNANLVTRARELEASNQDLEAFAYTVSHDLRTPLTIINGYSQVMMELCSGSLDERCTGYVQDIHRQSLSMNRLIDTLLSFSRLTRRELDRTTVDLGELAREIAIRYRGREPERRITFAIAEGVTANGDASLLRVVLDNLIGNAWKYTGGKEEAIIEFGITEYGEKPAYFVRDNGTGFAMAHADKIFAAFQRLHVDSEFEGIGIGLATVQRIIQRHGGRVWAEGEEGKGATFYFTLS